MTITGKFLRQNTPILYKIFSIRVAIRKNKWNCFTLGGKFIDGFGFDKETYYRKPNRTIHDSNKLAHLYEWESSPEGPDFYSYCLNREADVMTLEGKLSEILKSKGRVPVLINLDDLDDEVGSDAYGYRFIDLSEEGCKPHLIENDSMYLTIIDSNRFEIFPAYVYENVKLKKCRREDLVQKYKEEFSKLDGLLRINDGYVFEFDENSKLKAIKFDPNTYEIPDVAIENSKLGLKTVPQCTEILGFGQALLNAGTKDSLNDFTIISEESKLTLSYSSLDKVLKAANSGKKSVVKSNTTVGRFIKKYNPDTPSIQIEAEVNYIKTLLEPPKMELVTGYDIAKYYNGFYYSQSEDINSLRSSCMKYDRCQRYLGIYVRNSNVKLLIARSSLYTDKIVARALVWENVIDLCNNSEGPFTVMDRYYGPEKYKEAFYEYARENGWVRKATTTAKDFNFVYPNGGIINNEFLAVPLEVRDFRFFPYLDTFKSPFYGLDGKFYLKSYGSCLSGQYGEGRNAVTYSNEFDFKDSNEFPAYQCESLWRKFFKLVEDEDVYESMSKILGKRVNSSSVMYNTSDDLNVPALLVDSESGLILTNILTMEEAREKGLEGRTSQLLTQVER